MMEIPSCMVAGPYTGIFHWTRRYVSSRHAFATLHNCILLINMAQNPQISCYEMEVIQEKIGTKMTKFMVISYLAMVLAGWE